MNQASNEMRLSHRTKGGSVIQRAGSARATPYYTVGDVFNEYFVSSNVVKYIEKNVSTGIQVRDLSVHCD